MQTCHILIGVPGAGKSTWIKNHLSAPFDILCPDNILQERYDYQWTPQRARKAWAICYQRYAASLRAGKAIVWDATFLRAVDRAPVLNIALGFGYHTVAVVVQAPLEICLQRNRQRKRIAVPEKKIVAMHKVMVVPDKMEGFAEILFFNSG